ncbi:YihY family inner membrane protein [Herbaspirillum sp. RTI4]|uniref:YihY family inner membrane protein n=1 Tax=Herbaspirillum sp. RTI4 TaxID=3048640 RepID=UPI002AB447EE|nr:YihY family inner membrane protein [Herbaspirillum sp. RTI4]MDY7578026.1 YihY family inner membrane protein [Herbaspirillum sp. RTI4]MEA9982044.1 YihY family inner membrane protein [Herbaspirillum sp. RTI4]
MVLFRLPHLHGLTWPKARLFARFILQRLNEDRLPQVAGSLTFTTILSLVPVLTIALALFTAFPLFGTFRATLEAYFAQSSIPQGMASTILGYLNQFASKSARLSALGGVALIFTTYMTMATIDRIFNQIWRVKQSRPLMRRVLVYWAIITLGPLLIGLSVSVTSHLYAATNGVVASLPLGGAGLYTLVSILLTTAAYTLLYSTVPHQQVEWRDALWGGLLAGICVEGAKRLFAVYVLQFPTYTMIYGAVAALPIFLIWIYMLWLITLMGALLTAILPVIRYERWWHVPRPGSEFVDAMTLLRVLHEARSKGTSALADARTLRRKTRIGYSEIRLLLGKMVAAGWVGTINTEISPDANGGRWNRHAADRMGYWMLLAHPDQLTLADVYRLFVFNAAAHASGDRRLIRQVGVAVEDALGQTLTTYFSGSADASTATAATSSAGYPV